MVSIAWATDKGTQRKTNQDACCIEVANSQFGEVAMAVMCDGVGGLSLGELASSSVVRRFASWFHEELPGLIPTMTEGFDLYAVRDSWQLLIARVNDDLRAEAKSRDTLLGTTLTSLIACDGMFLVAHVGDCRAYRVEENRCVRLTRDQTLLTKLLAEGRVDHAEACTHPARHVILQAVGVTEQLEPAYTRGSYSDDDLFVLASDGAYGDMDNDDLRKAFASVDRTDETGLRTACKVLIARRMRDGATDNLSVACMCPRVRTSEEHDTVVVDGSPW